MCIILIMIVIKNCIIFLINSSSPSHCRLTVTSSVFFFNVEAVNIFLILIHT